MPCPREAAAEAYVEVEAEFEQKPNKGNDTMPVNLEHFGEVETLIKWLSSVGMIACAGGQDSAAAASRGRPAADGQTRDQLVDFSKAINAVVGCSGQRRSQERQRRRPQASSPSPAPPSPAPPIPPP